MRHLIVADIHANLAALDAVLAAATASGGFDEIWCLGDVVGYGPDPNECIARLREHRHLAVVGNHDLAALDRIDLADFNPDAAAAVRWTRRHLTPENRAYLESLPERLEQADVTLVHGSPRDPIWEYVLTPEVAAASFRHFRTPFCLVGHSHIPLLFRLVHEHQTMQLLTAPDDVPLRPDVERWILNPGGVGQPRDRDPRAAFALLDDQAAVLHHDRVPYDVNRTQRRMLDAGLPYRLVERLAYGW